MFIRIKLKDFFKLFKKTCINNNADTAKRPVKR